MGEGRGEAGQYHRNSEALFVAVGFDFVIGLDGGTWSLHCSGGRYIIGSINHSLDLMGSV